MSKYFNPSSHRVFVNDKDGNEISVVPLELMNTNHAPQGAVFFVEGDHFEQYVAFGQLAVLKDNIATKKEVSAPVVTPVSHTSENTSDQQTVETDEDKADTKPEEKPEATTSASIASTVRSKKGRK